MILILLSYKYARDAGLYKHKEQLYCSHLICSRLELCLEWSHQYISGNSFFLFKCFYKQYQILLTNSESQHQHVQMHDNSATSAQCTALAFTCAFALPILCLLSLAFSIPNPLLAVEFAAGGTAQALTEVPERHWEPGHAKVCSQVATELWLPGMGSPNTTQSLQLLCYSLFHLLLIHTTFRALLPPVPHTLI